MPFARADDKVRIYYEAHGSRAPLVLAYGIGGVAEMVVLSPASHFGNRHQPEAWNPTVRG